MLARVVLLILALLICVTSPAHAQMEIGVEDTPDDVIALERPTPASPVHVEGELDDSDVTLSSDKYRHVYALKVDAGQTLRIDLRSADFDTYLMASTPDAEPFDNDDFGGTYSSRLVFTVQDHGTCHVVVTTYNPGETGTYELTLQSVSADVVASHEVDRQNLEEAAELNQEGITAYRAGRYADAEPLYRRALAIFESALGPDHPDTASSLNNLAVLLEGQGRYADAEPLFRRALAIRETALGPDHPDTASSLGNLAGLLHDQGRTEEAFGLVDSAVRTFDAAPTHPDWRAASYATRARLHRHLGRPREALHDLEEALRTIEEMRSSVGGSEDIRAMFFSDYTDMYDRMIAWQLESGDMRPAFEYVERSRARTLLDQIAAGKIDLRAGIPPDVLTPLEVRERRAQSQLAGLQQQITVTRGRTDLSDAERTARIDVLEDSLSDARRAYQQVYADIKNASPLWRDQLTSGGRPVDLRSAQRRLVSRDGLMLLYHVSADTGLVFVVPARGDIDVVPLSVDAPAAAVLGTDTGPLTNERLTAILASDSTRGRTGIDAGMLGALGTRGLDPRDGIGGMSDEELTRRLHALWQVLAPGALWQRVKAADEAIVIPDAELHALPFEALVVAPAATPQATRYWLDEGPALRYAPSATALYTLTDRPRTRFTARSGAARVLSLADPIYSPTDVAAALNEQEREADSTSSAALRPRTRDAYERAGGSLARLPGTARETSAIETAYGEEAERAVFPLQQLAADEPTLRENVRGKRYLHLATHGLVDAGRGSLFASLALTPPLSTDSLSNDGFLELHEIYQLPLDETELAVLSACATNVGRRVEGEGVFALSRGFLAAGARRVIASQWAVNDASTAALIGAFFDDVVEAERSGQIIDYATALHRARQDVRSNPNWAAPYHWAPFILIGKE